MGTLDRYQKAGGFIQLLNVIETCGPAKQENFLKIIRTEDRSWADAIEQKMLSMQKILSWDDQTVAEIAGSIQELTLATALAGFDEAGKVKFTKMMSNAQKRKIDDLIGDKKPAPAEVSTAFMKIITETRKMISENRLRVEKFAPEMHIPDGIEEHLKKGTLPLTHSASLQADGDSAAPASDSHDAGLSSQNLGTELQFVMPSGAGDHAAKEEIAALRKRIQVLNQENTHLKQEVQTMKTKIDQIKRLAA